MSPLFEILNSAGTLTGIGGLVVLTLAFWKLNLLAPTRAGRVGLIASLANLGVWLIHGMLWAASMLPLNVPVYRIYEIPLVFEGLWMLGTAALVTSLLCLACTLHRGIHPKEPGA